MTRGTKRLLLGTAAIVAVSLVFLIEERVRGVVALSYWQAQMRAKGEKLSVAEIVPLIPPNSACHILSPQQAASWLAAVSSPSVSIPGMRYVAPGKAQATWQADSWGFDRKRTNNWARAASSLETLMPAIDKLRDDLTNQAFVVRLDVSQRLTVLPPHLPLYKMAVWSLNNAAQLALHQQRLNLATENLVAIAALVDLSGSEGRLISELVCNAIAATGVSALWPALQAEGWSDSQLAAIQAAWEKPNFMRGMARAFEVERAVDSLFYDRSRYSLLELRGILGDGGMPPSGVAANAASSYQLGWGGEALRTLVELGARFRYGVGLGVWRVSWMEQDQLRQERLLQQAIDRMRRAASEKRFLAEPQPPDQGTPSSGDRSRVGPIGWRRAHYWVSTRMVPGLIRVSDNAVLTEAQRGLAVTALAIKRYQLRHKGLPERLEALVPEFLPSVPRDWYADTPLHYQPKADGSFLLYSVGPDREDNGGDARPRVAHADPSFDRTYDLVWPQPATAAEIAAFEATLW